MKNTNKSYSSILITIFILGILYWIFYAMMPQSVSENQALSEFSTKRASNIIKEISKNPHYVGSENHTEVAKYIVSELEKIGLETSIQESISFSDGVATQTKNILARIKGTNSKKALLLLAHYDSAPHSFSHGASDDGSGIATILEGVRAFLYNKTTHKNDIIILFSDAEELGLNGAALFVKNHIWAKEVGLVLNFEARGSSGPSYMLMETNVGNAKLINEFVKANPEYPVSNSLMYSIYKMLPNDTDLTVFREKGKIQGFNFAFIDNHFNYHTQQDNFENLDVKTITHQGTYLMPLLVYFSNSELKMLESKEDYVYFNTPLGFVTYPFSWISPMVILALVLFVFLVFIGIGKRIIDVKEIIIGFIPLLLCLIFAGGLTFFGWKLALQFYPQYNDILQGFTYNGHDYIVAFVLMSLSICFMIYQKMTVPKSVISHSIAPLLLWIIINFGVAFQLQGASFLIIPVFSSLIMLAYFVITQKNSWILNLLLSIPTLIIIAPFIQMFPIGLGLKILFGSSILTVLCFGLLIPLFETYLQKGFWALLLFIASLGFFIKADYNSGYSLKKEKPNSLVYYFDADKNKAFWATYDIEIDEWTKKYLSENPKNASQLNVLPLSSKYNSKFTFMNNAVLKNIPSPTIEFLKDSVIGDFRHLKIKISPQRKVNRYDIFANRKLKIFNFRVNNTKSVDEKTPEYFRTGKKILSYYVVDNLPLELEFDINSKSVLDMDLTESSFDLMSSFGLTQRNLSMMPKPFVLTDAIILKQKIRNIKKLQIQFVNKLGNETN